MSERVNKISRVSMGRIYVRPTPTNSVYPRYFFAALALILVAGLGLRVWNLGSASLWTDEVLSAYRAESPLSESVQSILRAGNQMPLYFFALRAVPANDDTMLRLPSAILGVIGIVLLVLMVLSLYGDYDLALCAGALLAFNPFHIWLSRTARYYTLVFILALVISCSFLWLLRGHRTRRVWIIFTVSSMVAYMTHYTTLALPAAQCAMLVPALRAKDGRFLRQWITAQCVAMIPMVVWLGILAHTPPEVGPRWVPVPKLDDIPQTLWHMSIGYTTTWGWDVVLGRIAVAGALIAGIWSALHNQRTNRESLYWLNLIVITLVVVFTISISIVSFYVDRYFMVLLPALILILAQGITQLPYRVGQVVLATIVVASTVHVLASFGTGDYVREDWQSATALIAHNIQADDGVIVERTNVEQAFLRYYPASGYDMPALVRLDDGLGEIWHENSFERIWVIYRNPYEDIHREGAMPAFDPFDSTLTPLGDWLIAHRDLIIEQRIFNGITVILLDLGREQPIAVGEDYSVNPCSRTCLSQSEADLSPG